jgi:hypothetical protein
VVGWVTYRTLRRQEGVTALSDIATVIAAVGGGAVTAIFKSEDLFGSYSIGLLVGFGVYYILGLIFLKGDAKTKLMGT